MPPRLRRFVAGCSLASFCLLLIGVPVPQPVHKEAARPFPCQHHACGCFDAEACWASCCCFTHAEKAAWAQEHGLAPVELASAPAASPAAAMPQSECCAARPCDATAACEEPEGQYPRHCGRQPASHRGESKSPIVLVWGAKIMQCQGGAAVWRSIGPSPVPPPVFELSLESDVVERIALSDDHRLEIRLSLASPPPELG